MNTIDKYIIRKYLTTFVFTMAIFAVVIVVFDISEKLDDFLKHNAPIEKIIFEYYAGMLPFYLNMLSPLINFIAVIFFTAKMADQTEVVPILSGGMSFNRFMRPYMIAAGLIFAVSFIFNIFIIPHTNKLMTDFENVYIKPLDQTNRRSTHMQIDDKTYVYIGDFDTKYDEGYNFVMEKFEGNELKEKWLADRIVWDSIGMQWSIRNYSIRYIDELKESMVSGAQIDTVLDMLPSDFVVYENAYTAMGTFELGERIEKEKLRGTGILVNLRLELYKRFVNPFSAFVLTLMGVALSSKKVRGGIGLSLGLGIGLSFTYIVFIQFSTIFASQGGFPPLLAVWIPNLIFGIIALILLIKAPK